MSTALRAVQGLGSKVHGGAVNVSTVRKRKCIEGGGGHFVRGRVGLSL